MRAKGMYCAHMQLTVHTGIDTELGVAIQASDLKKVDLAAKAGISPSHLTRALRLERPIARRAIEIIVGELGLDLEAVYDGRSLRVCTNTPSRDEASGELGESISDSVERSVEAPQPGMLSQSAAPVLKLATSVAQAEGPGD